MSTTIFIRSLVAIIGAIGITLQIAKDGAGMLLYYTIISNIVITLFSAFLVFFEVKKSSTNSSKTILRLKGGATLSTAITFMIYHFLLAPLVSHEQFWNARNLIVHYAVPLLFISDSLIFDRKNSYKLLDPIIWTVLPLIYSFFAIFNGLVLKFEIPGSPDSPFPYYFLNIDKYGFSGVINNSVEIFVSYVLAGYIWLVAKKFIGAKIATAKKM